LPWPALIGNSESSPCISAGVDSLLYLSAWHHCPPYDFYGISRPYPIETTPDMGACEHPDGWVNDIQNPESVLPASYELNQNYPNPFNPTTKINYELPITNDVNLSVYNLLGQKVVTLVNEQKKAGYHQVAWDASGFASGIYYYRIQAGEFQDVKKMLLLK